MGLDETGRFVAGDYVCTSFIGIREGNIFIIKSGRFYECICKEQDVEMNISDLDMHRNGISPNMLVNLWVV